MPTLQLQWVDTFLSNYFIDLNLFEQKCLQTSHNPKNIKMTQNISGPNRSNKARDYQTA